MDSKDLQLVRETLGVTREAFAYLLGCSAVQVCAMETGKRTITPKYRAALLGVMRGSEYRGRTARLSGIREELERERKNGEI